MTSLRTHHEHDLVSHICSVCGWAGPKSHATASSPRPDRPTKRRRLPRPWRAGWPVPERLPDLLATIVVSCVLGLFVGELKDGAAAIFIVTCIVSGAVGIALLLRPLSAEVHQLLEAVETSKPSAPSVASAGVHCAPSVAPTEPTIASAGVRSFCARALRALGAPSAPAGRRPR